MLSLAPSSLDSVIVPSGALSADSAQTGGDREVSVLLPASSSQLAGKSPESK